MDEKTINLTGVNSPYLAQYLGLWSLVENVLEAAFDRISTMDLRLHVEQHAQQQSKAPEKPKPSMYAYEVTAGGVAILEAVGTLMKAQSSLGDSTSTVMLRRTIRDAISNPNVKAILIRIDSPGGTTDGTEELASDVNFASQQKPVGIFVDGIAASAAYWLASQGSVISAGPTAIVGSIGTYMVVRDTSSMAAQNGIKVHLVKSAEAKGAGVPGTEITAKQLTEWQRLIDDSQAVFTAAVAKGRRVSLDKAKEWADARVHVGATAKTLGLIDYVESFDAALARMEKAASQQPTHANGARNGLSRITMKAGEQTVMIEGPTPSDVAQMASEFAVRDGTAELSTAIHNSSPTNQHPGTVAGDESQQAAAAAGDVLSRDGAEANYQSGDTTPEKGSDMSQTQTAPPNSATEQPKPNAASPATAPAAGAISPVPATMADLQAACVGASSDFLVDCSVKNMSIAQAKDAFIGWQSAQIRSRDEELTKAKATQAEQPAGRRPGLKPVESSTARQAGTSTQADGDPVEVFNSAVDEQMKKPGYTDRKKAIAAVSRRGPQLHQEYLEATNPGREQRDRIRDRFAQAV